MAVNRACLALLFLVCFKSVAAKPFFGDWWCDLIICDDYDDDTSTSSSTTTTSDYDYGCDCRPTTRRTTTRAPTTAAPSAVQPTSFNVEIPPDSNGVSLQLVNSGNGWSIMMMPRPSGSGTATTTSATTTVVTTTAGSTTAGGTTVADSSPAASDTAESTTAAAK